MIIRYSAGSPSCSMNFVHLFFSSSLLNKDLIKQGDLAYEFCSEGNLPERGDLNVTDWKNCSGFGFLQNRTIAVAVETCT